MDSCTDPSAMLRTLLNGVYTLLSSAIMLMQFGCMIGSALQLHEHRMHVAEVELLLTDLNRIRY
jgi:hypothetical protein